MTDWRFQLTAMDSDLTNASWLPLREAYGTDAESHAHTVTVTSPTKENGLLTAFPREVYMRLSQSFKPVVLNIGTALDITHDHAGHLVFPRSCVVSMRREMLDGNCADIALIGSEGVIGGELLMGGRSRSSCAVVHAAGSAIRLPLRVAEDEFNRGGAFQRVLLRFSQALHNQTAQAAICRRLHSIEQDLCRWLLLLHDRIGSNHLLITHEQIATSLGVRREGITIAMGLLQSSGLLSCGRGQVSIIERAALERRGCDCYQMTRTEYAHLLGAAHTYGGNSKSLSE